MAKNPMLPDFETSKERDEWMMVHAEAFTVIRFLGVGKYERHEVKTFNEASELASKLANEIKRPYLIYALVPPYDSFIRSVYPDK